MWNGLQEDQLYSPQIISVQSEGIRYKLTDLGQQGSYCVFIEEVDDTLHLGLVVLLLL